MKSATSNNPPDRPEPPPTVRPPIPPIPAGGPEGVSDLVGVPAVLCNDADVAGLAEALFGAGKGMSPVFYMTIGSGIGGGLIVDGQIYRGVGRGAAEIGHLQVYAEGVERGGETLV